MQPFRSTIEIDRWLDTVSSLPNKEDVGTFSCIAYGRRGRVIPFARDCMFVEAR